MTNDSMGSGMHPNDRHGSSVAFPYKVGWVDDYASLFRSEWTDTTAIDELLQRAGVGGRVMLLGRGGSGKTTIAMRLRQTSQNKDIATSLVNLKHWNQSIRGYWDGSGKDHLSQAEILLTELAEPRRSLSQIDQLGPKVPKLIIVDGLNEVRGPVAEDIIRAVDLLARTFVNLSVIVTDRLTRRQAIDKRWQMAMVLPLEGSAVEHILDSTIGTNIWSDATSSQRQFLENPFFLDKTIEDRRLTASSSEAIESYLRRHAALDDQGLSLAAKGAFAMYDSQHSSRTFRLMDFVGETGDAVAAELTKAGVLLVEGEAAYFEHHLFHDYLASRYVAHKPELWNYSALNSISFGASSFDAIALVLEQLDTANADNFVRHVYDWNPYAAAYAMSETDVGEVSREMAFVIAAMLSERLSDFLVRTAERSSDALSILGTEEARVLLGSPSEAERLQFVRDFNSVQQWFLEWQKLFVRPSGSEALPEDLALLSSPDPIMGWTAANVLRRLIIDEGQFSKIELMVTTASSQAQRWRCVHVLGAFPAEARADALFEALLSDEDQWVRYGALRSLMEMAARSTALRSRILNGLAEQLDLLEAQPKLRDEFARAAFASGIDEKETWLAGIGKIVRELARRADTPDFEKWLKLGDELTTYLAAA